MVRHHQPRKGSVAFSPRKRVAKETPRIKAWPSNEEPKLLGLAGYKAGMTHAMVVDNDKNSPSHGMTVFTPVTVLEVPPLVIMGIRSYENTAHGLKAITEVIADNLDEELSRKITLPKDYDKSEAIAKIQDALDKTEDVRVLVHTNPKMASVPKKKPEIFECALGGSSAEETTKGKGVQGVVKRWNIRIQYGKAMRSGKGRHVGSIGPWSPERTMWTVAQAGQMGYHKRTEFNKKVLKIGDVSEVDAVNPDGGFIRYGLVKNDYVLVKGSVPGPTKRLVILRQAIRPKKADEAAPQIEFISTASKQGV